MTLDIEKLKQASLAIRNWRLEMAWLDTSEDESAAVVGHIDEDGNEYAVITVDCDKYYQGQDSLPLAKYYAQANPSVVIELIARLEAAERSAARWADVFGHLGTPDECGNEWSALVDKLEAAEREISAQNKQLAAKDEWIAEAISRRARNE